MKDTILVLGAAGRLGHAAAEAFREAGWQVRGLVRRGRKGFAPHGIDVVEAYSRDEAIEAGRGCSVVLNALSPPLTEWRRHALPLAYSAIAVAEDNGATLLFPGNVWNFGRDMPAVIGESTPPNPCSRKGRMRVDIEQRIAEACDRGMKAVVLRSGDFFGAGRGSWFDLVVVKELERGRITYPGPPDVEHAWAYLPDYADTLVRLAERRADFARMEAFGFAGHTLTGRQLVAEIEAATGGTFNVRQMSWWMLKTFGQVLAMGRELAELEFLWTTPHRISGDRLADAIGDVPHTPLRRAVASSLRELGHIR